MSTDGRAVGAFAGPGVVLDTLDRDDVAALLGMWRDPDAVRFLNVRQPAQLADAVAFVERARAGRPSPVLAHPTHPTPSQPGPASPHPVSPDPGQTGGTAADAHDVTFAVRAHAAGVLLGTIALHGPAPYGEISIATTRSARGRGVATAAGRLLLDWAGSHGYERLGWECLADNAASIALAERLGFVFDRSGPSTSLLHHRGKPARFATLHPGVRRVVTSGDRSARDPDVG